MLCVCVCVCVCLCVCVCVCVCVRVVCVFVCSRAWDHDRAVNMHDHTVVTNAGACRTS